MRRNDIAVNLKALDGANRRLSRTMDELEQFAAQLMRNMEVAGREFDTANFEQAEAVIRDVFKKLGLASERMGRACAYLDEVFERAESYLKCKYIG